MNQGSWLRFPSLLICIADCLPGYSINTSAFPLMLFTESLAPLSHGLTLSLIHGFTGMHGTVSMCFQWFTRCGCFPFFQSMSDLNDNSQEVSSHCLRFLHFLLPQRPTGSEPDFGLVTYIISVHVIK